MNIPLPRIIMIVSSLFRLYSLYSRFSYRIDTIVFKSLTLFYFQTSDSFIDMTQSTDIESELAGKLSSSFSYNAIKSEAVAIESDSDSELFLAVSNMRIDRYFSGFKEEASSIMNDAKELLQHHSHLRKVLEVLKIQTSFFSMSQL